MDEYQDDEADEKVEEDNRRYLAAKCTKPHANGSTCLPEWDGFMYICFHRMCRRSESNGS